MEKFNPDAEYDVRRSDLGVPADKVLVGMLARLTIQKDPLTFLRAVKYVTDRDDSAHFIIVGGGELEETCRAEAQKLGITNHITFEAFRTDVPAVLKLMDVYCLPSLWEGLPIGILEAMAMRKAIVATPVDGTKEVIKSGQTGILFEEYNHEEMGEAILQFIKNEQKRKTLGSNARQVIENSFGVKRMATEVGDLYEKVLKAKMVEAGET
ncbi:MAG: glycosyltransferase [Owenweeksia sp.]|nr:glycosyltransferase [Owenweeksia sp.]